MEINQGCDPAGKSKRKPVEEIEVYHPVAEMIPREPVMLDNDPMGNQKRTLEEELYRYPLVMLNPDVIGGNYLSIHMSLVFFASTALLQPLFSWRILWLMNLPTTRLRFGAASACTTIVSKEI